MDEGVLNYIRQVTDMLHQLEGQIKEDVVSGRLREDSEAQRAVSDLHRAMFGIFLQLTPALVTIPETEGTYCQTNCPSCNYLLTIKVS